MTGYPPVSAMCLTYGRPHLLEEAIQSFLAQDYPGPKELVVLNDFADQTLVCDHAEVRVINTAQRFATVGEKRNACATLARHNILFVWDDDDLYLPWRLSLSVRRLDESKGYYKSPRAWILNDGELQGPTTNLYHSAACFTRDLFESAGRYPHIGSGQDWELENAITHLIPDEKDDWSLSPHEMYYIYRWHGTGSYHLSAFGRDEGKPISGQAKVAQFLEGQLRAGKLSTGVIRLTPAWRDDYLGLVEARIRSPQNPPSGGSQIQPRTNLAPRISAKSDERNGTSEPSRLRLEGLSLPCGAKSTSASLPLISCIMPTYGRPRYVPEALWCFVEQDYPNKELIILNDCAEQEFQCDVPGVRIENVKRRFATLGEKRNAAIELASGEVIVVWDDDDISLPWRLSFTWSEMCRHQTPFYRPAEFRAYWGSERLHDNQSVAGWVSHGTVALSKALWREVGGYPAMNVGEDGKFFEGIHRFLGREFVKYPIAARDRFYVLRGTSDYRHMSINGGRQPLDVAPGSFVVEPREIADEVLRKAISQAILEHGIHHPDVLRNGSRVSTAPLLSVCVALKNRSRVPHENRLLDLFPRCVRALSDAARELGPVELVVADFGSEDWPLQEWLHGAGSLAIKIVPMTGSFSRGRGLNAAVRAAASSALFLMDADILVSTESLRCGLEHVQSGKAGFPICRYLDGAGNPQFWQDLGKGLAFLSRQVYELSGGVPEFDNWEGEDDLFLDRVQRHCPVVRLRDAGLLHQWHPEWCRHVNYQHRAQSDFKAHSIRSTSESPRVLAVFEGRHSCWTGGERHIRFYENGRCERPGVDSGGYEWSEGERISLKWDRWAEELLQWDADGHVYRNAANTFTLRRIESASDVVQSLRRACSELAEHLRSLSPFQYFDCGGNRGDLVIRAGTLAFFRSLGVEYREARSLRDVTPGLPAVLSGSGGFCRFWKAAPQAARELSLRCPELVVLPSTFEKSALEVLRGRRNVFLYAREHVSLAEVASEFPAAFCPDLAFWVDLPEGLTPSRNTGWVFRTDPEGFGLTTQFPGNCDLSIMGAQTAMDFIKDVGDFNVLYTDRTHAAIVAAMLGREVHFFPNRYHKNRGIFDAYLWRFNCTWHDATGAHSSG